VSAFLRQFRRAPGRILASVLALSLAVGAIGVLAIPAISEGSLHEAVARDGLGDVIVPTTPLDAEQIARIEALPNVRSVNATASVATRLDGVPGDGGDVRVVGLAADRELDLLQIADGRDARTAGEVVASPGLAEVGDVLRIDGRDATVVGVGTTLLWNADDVVFAGLDDVLPLAPEQGTNWLSILAVDDDEPALRELVTAIRPVLAEGGDTFVDFPEYLPDGSTPIDQDIRQVSTLIGMLGVMAGIVALVLLASTTNTLITERTREVAVMRALGGRRRPLRRRLRRIALGITAVALVIGLPFGVLISNVIARMVLEEFVGITPTVAVDWWVVAASAAGALLGARLVAARAARRVTNQPLAAALRDREGDPYGARWYQRLVARVPSGGGVGRLAARASIRRPGRTAAVVAQIAAAVGVAFLVPSLATSVNEFNDATFESWQWDATAEARDPGLPFDAAIADGVDGVESGVWVFGSIDDREIDAWGLAPGSAMFDPELRSGRWFEAGTREVAISAGFAERRGIGVGDIVDVELASGASLYTVVGTVDDHALSVYLDRDVLAADMGAPGMANMLYALDGRAGALAALDLPVAVDLSTMDEIQADAGAGRDAIVLVFGAIGVIVAGVAALAVMSSMLVSLFERRHELAALQALGARRQRLRRLLVAELVPLGVVGTVLGLGLGALGTRAIIGSFEASNSVDIGVVDALGAVPLIGAGALAALVGLALLAVRSAARRPITVTLRGAA
jgi:putative ABC transport system permease protein